MNKIVLSLVSIMALSGLAYAGGNFASVEDVVEVPVVEDQSAFYVGLGFGSTTIDNSISNEEISSTMLMLQGGYQYNQYVSFEGRYTFGLSTDYKAGNIVNPPFIYDGQVDSWGIYVKPMYPIGDFSVYALLGYGGVQLNDILNGNAYEYGFQWGLGAQYAVTESILVFADYVKLYDDTGFDYVAQQANVDADTWTVGLSYRF